MLTKKGTNVELGDQTNTYYAIASTIYRTSKNSPPSQYVNQTTYILENETSPLYNGEVNASLYITDHEKAVIN